jgi:hypothetical protein
MIGVAIGANEHHRLMALYSAARAIDLGYAVRLFDLGGLGCGERIESNKGDFKKTPHVGYLASFKMDIVARVLEDYEHVVLLDADASLEGFIDPVFEEEFDLGLTLRPLNDQGLLRSEHFDSNNSLCERYGAGYFNTGVMFFKRSPTTLSFVETWRESSFDIGSDQAGMNRLVTPYMSDWDPWTDPAPPKFVTTPYGRVRVFDMDTYNNTLGGTACRSHLEEPLPKILHWKNEKALMRWSAKRYRRDNPEKWAQILQRTS